MFQGHNNSPGKKVIIRIGMKDINQAQYYKNAQVEGKPESSFLLMLLI